MSETPSSRAQALLREGLPADALRELQAGVRADAANSGLRVFLAQLLMVLGAWERALAQLQVAAQMDSANTPMAYAYRQAIAAERIRGEVFAGRRRPALLGEPEAWMAAQLDAVSALGSAAGRNAETVAAVMQALAGAPQIPGRLDGQPFDWLGDSDMRIGPMFELLVNGNYLWVAGQYIQSLTLEAPQDLRDLVWVPGHAVWSNGGTAAIMMPTRYPGSESAAPLLQLARRTEYAELLPEFWIGLGQRVLATDSGEYSLLDVREIEFDRA